MWKKEEGIKLERDGDLAQKFLCHAGESGLYLLGVMGGFGDGSCVSLAARWVRRGRGVGKGYSHLQSLG